MTMRRIRPPGLVPLEIWDIELEGTLLYEQPERLFEGLTLLREGRARTRFSRSPLDAARNFDSLFLGGGRRIVVPPTPYPVAVSRDGAFVGEAGGLALLGGDGVVVDVGQTAIKVSSPDERRMISRDLATLPIRAADAADHDVPAQRVRSREFLASALGGARRIVLALPCELGDDGVPGRCSYIGWEGDRTLVADALRLAGNSEAEVLLLQDGELAALSAPERPGKTLVVTLGYAVAAALRTAP